jgi:hypothetical protein
MEGQAMRRTEYVKQQGTRIARRTTRQSRRRDDVRGFRMIDGPTAFGQEAAVGHRRVSSGRLTRPDDTADERR